MMKKPKIQILRWCCIILFLAIFVLSAYKLTSSYIDYFEGSAAYDNLKNETFSDARNGIADVIVENKDESEELADVASGNQPIPTMDFSGLLDINEDCVAWIKLPNTVIDYPVVQGRDNAYYLNHLLSGKQNKCGTLFVDCRNSRGFIDKNTIIYGHNMQNGSMFSSLEYFKKQSFYNDNSVFVLYTPEKTYKLEPFAGIVVTADFDNFPLSFASVDTFLRYIEASKEKSTFKSDVEITADDKIVTLCTCTYNFTNARFALLCRLV